MASIASSDKSIPMYLIKKAGKTELCILHEKACKWQKKPHNRY